MPPIKDGRGGCPTYITMTMTMTMTNDSEMIVKCHQKNDYGSDYD